MKGCELLTLGVMPPHRYTPPVASALRPREPASAPMMARNRSTASTARGLLPSSAAFVIAGASCCDMNRAQIATNGRSIYE